MLRSYKYRIYPNKMQEAALSEMLRDFCDLYNAALQQRIEAWRRCGKSIRYFDQSNELKPARAVSPELSRWSFTAELRVLRKLQRSFDAFFRRVRAGDNPGFPRFKASARYRAAEFCVGDGMSIRKSGKVRVVGIPNELKVKWHRDMPCKPQAAMLTRQAGKWFITFTARIDAIERASPYSIGVDLGLSSLAALSNGELIPRERWTKDAERGLRKRQRAVQRCKRRSKSRQKRILALARYHAKIANKRKDALHKVSRDLVNRFGRIAIEEINVKGLARSALAKSFQDASWAQLTSMIEYKAESAGVEVIKVDPRYTSQTCPACGTVKAKTLDQRMHICECGCTLDRDVAAAMVVHHKAFGFTPGAGDGSLSVSVAA